MSPRTLFLGIAAAAGFAFPAFAQGIEVHDAYARSSGPTAPTGAAFMVIHNMGETDDRLIAARSEAAERVELHTHLSDENGLMQMRKIEGGIAIPAGGAAALERGGDHVMFLGLTAPFVAGETVPLVLLFEQAGEIAIDVPVDNDRAPEEDHAGH